MKTREYMIATLVIQYSHLTCLTTDSSDGVLDCNEPVGTGVYSYGVLNSVVDLLGGQWGIKFDVVEL